MEIVKKILDRKEFAALVVAAVVEAIAASGLPAAIGLAIPEEQISLAVSVAIAAFVAAVVEGKFKAEAYAEAWSSLLRSTKFRLTLVTLGGTVVNAALAPLGLSLPDEVIVKLGEFVLASVLFVGGLDAYRASEAAKKVR